MRHFLLLLAVMAGAGATGASAEDRAVIIGNADYQLAPDLAGSDTAALVGVMQKAGFATAQGVDLVSAETRRTLDLLAREDSVGGARIVMLSGRFLGTGDETWFMGVEAGKCGPLGAADQGVPLGLVMQLMAEGGKGAVLLLGTDGQEMPHEAGVKSGIGGISPPEGVSVITGSPEATARALRELAAGRTVARALAAGQGLRLLPGGAPDLVPVRPARPVGPAAPDPIEAERAAFAEAMALDSVRGYGTYLERFPAGSFAGAARERRAGLLLTVRRAGDPVEIEAALRLDRDHQRKVQQSLARLGLDPGPQDGLIGDQTREALRSWQRANRFDPTGYLSAVQLAQLLQDEAGESRESWMRAGARSGIERLRAYFTRAPGGILVAEAGRNRAEAVPPSRDDQSVWRWARRQDSAAAYQLYLERFSQGGHAAEAKLRRDNLSAASEAARRAEMSLGLSAATLRRIEDRLEQLGLEPGTVDGSFTDQSRAALRRYQAAMNLDVTGYVSQRTLDRLLSDAPG